MPSESGAPSCRILAQSAHKLADPRGTCLGDGHGAGDPPPENNRDAVRNLEHMIKLGGNIENGNAPHLEVEQLVLHEFDGTNVESLAGLHDNENAGPRLDFTSQDD